MLNIRQQGDRITAYLTEFVADRTEEIEDLPTYPNAAKGSVCFCIEDGIVYILSGENEWVEMKTDGEPAPSGHTVPSEYKQLEYFDNSSGIYSLNTLFKPELGALSFEGKISLPMEYEGQAILGGFNAYPYDLRDVSTIWLSAIGNGVIRLNQRSFNSTDSPQNSFTLNTPFTLAGIYSSGYQSLTVNEVTSTNNHGDAVLPRDVWIGSNGGYGIGVCPFNLYYFKLYDGNTLSEKHLARDLVPVRRLSDDTYGCWDFVTEQFYVFR